MLDRLQIAGTVGTWVAVLLTFITLTAIIGPWLLLRQAYNERNRALNAVQDSNQDFVTKGVGFSKSIRFFRKTKVPSLAPNFDSWSHDIPLKIPATNECWTAKYPDPTTCRTGWAVFCRLLEAYSASQVDDAKVGTSPHHGWWPFTLGRATSPPQATGNPVVLPGGGSLVFKKSYTFLPVSRYWILVIGLLGRYARREDKGKAQMSASLRRDLNEERAYVEQNDINDIETALSKSDTVGFDFAAKVNQQNLFTRFKSRKRSASADSSASSISRVTDVSVPPVMATPGVSTLCGITGEFCRVKSDDTPSDTLMFTPHNFYEMGLLTLPITEPVSISTLFWLANGFIPVFSDTDGKRIARVICLEDPAGYSYEERHSFRRRRPRLGLAALAVSGLDTERTRAPYVARRWYDEDQYSNDESTDRYSDFDVGINEQNSYDARERDIIPPETTNDNVPLNKPDIDIIGITESEWVPIPDDYIVVEDKPEKGIQVDSHSTENNGFVDEQIRDYPPGSIEADGIHTPKPDETQSSDVTGRELVLYTGGTESQDHQEISGSFEQVEENDESYRSFRSRSRSRSRSMSPYRERSRRSSRSRSRSRPFRGILKSRAVPRARYRSRSPILSRPRVWHRSPPRFRSPPPVTRKITLCRATDCPKSLNLAMEALQIQFTSIDSMTVSSESPTNTGTYSRFDPFCAEAPDSTTPRDDDASNTEIGDGQEWISLPSPTDNSEYYISRVDVQTMVLAMLDIPWDPRGYLIGCPSQTSLWRMYMERMSTQTETALEAFRQLPWVQDPAIKKRFEEHSWLEKNPRASQPDTARLVDLDRFLTAIMREKKLQYRAIALGLFTDEDAHSLVSSLLYEYDPDILIYDGSRLVVDRETCKWSAKHGRTSAECIFIPESLVRYDGNDEVKEDAILDEDVVLVSLWACVRAELWLGSLNGDDLMDVVRGLKRTVHLI
ncbi:hypothetical protein F5B22DRAFT_530824 [Xylaria bambusicola]|uniref:uncharacterized protein n=1 Tax=Xylaria bambusicola TaxID=326684 RepID=UPI00200794EB|nr:uncharacterized protein F5B22DRAFT_530824 [Xylaria bambusicola]KAI0505257.1 hypothetical protein F5B22DRAFT_530824 [Xylaria bambusicola]